MKKKIYYHPITDELYIYHHKLGMMERFGEYFFIIEAWLANFTLIGDL